MAFESPNLDDRTFKDILAEAKRLIPRYAPEWTDWNESDPGITLIQLFAWMSELIIYRLNQVPEKNFIEFLRLVGVDLKPATPAKADLTFTLSTGTGTKVIPMGTRVGLADNDAEDPVVFETKEALVAVEAALEEIQVFDGSAYTLYTDANQVAGKNFYAFGSDGGEDNALYLGFDMALPESEIKLTINLYVEDLIATGTHCTMDESFVHPSADLVWEYYTGTTWAALDVVKDSTLFLMQDGSIYFNASAVMGATTWGASTTDSLYWIRCRVKKAGYEVVPRIDAILLNTVSAENATTVKGEIVGTSDGSPDQSFTLRKTPVIDKTLVLQVNEGDGWKTWTRVDTLASSTPEDEHYGLDRSSGDITFGDGVQGRIPLPLTGGNNIMALQYRYGGGISGNSGSNTITSLESAIPGVESVTNFFASSGGEDEESVEAAKLRGPMELKTRQRAVTTEDFEFLATQTPGVRVRRALAMPLYHPDFPACDMPGVVTVIIVPESKDAKPMPSQGMMKTVCAHLNRHRLLASEVYVLPPEYVKVKVDAEVIASPDADAATVKRRLRQNLVTYFHPLEGGNDGKGWAFGGDIYFSDVYKEILNTRGVQRIENISIYLDGEEQDECKNIRIKGNSLLYSDGHELDVQYERG